jgi:hypothetical protein
MRRSNLGRVLTWLTLALFLAAVAMALVIVWTANERVWYIDTGGVNATLDMALTPAARWIATGVLAVLLALGAGALVLSLRAPRRATDGAPPGMPLAGKTFTYVDQPPIAPPAEERTATPGVYHSTIVGDTEIRRAEESLPPTVVMRRDVVAAIAQPEIAEPAASAPEPEVAQQAAAPPPDETGLHDRTRIVFRRRSGNGR